MSSFFCLKTYNSLGEIMSKIEDFKNFVKENPNLIKYVKNNEMTWQKFYEIYDIYGSDNEVWNKYKVIEDKKSSIGDVINFFKGVDLDSVQEGVENIQRVVEMLGDLSVANTTKPEYKPRPLYKHFDD